ADRRQARGKKARLTPISPDVRTGAELLAAAGVRTLAFTNAAFVNPLLELTRGFESVSHHHAYNHEIRRADETIDAALAQLAEDDGRPTFCLIHLFDPHLDYDAPREFAQLYAEGASPRPALQWKDCSQALPGQRETVTPEHAARVRAAYDAEIAFVDAQIGRLVAELARRGDLARTTIVLTADHGEEFWDHGAFEHGHTLYDELVRVPLVVRTPAATPGQVLEVPVRTLDLMPTLCELFGVPPSAQFEGRSLLPVLRGEDREPRPIVMDSTLYGHDKVALRTERYKLILDRNPEAELELELYDWMADPLERQELSASLPELAERLRTELEARLAAYARQAKNLRPGELLDLSPAKQEEILQQLEVLGYGGD
ncbi:MAG: sulfatase-like hydrolase/transferase, partial [Planctomycetes bacterium]|nr:sulfatase-like hydrolase/transferase [Planctomycetota bacterium]